MKKKFKPNQYLDPFEGKLGQRIIETRIEENERLDREQQAAIDRLPFTVVKKKDFETKVLHYGKPGLYAIWDEGIIKTLAGVLKTRDGKPHWIEIQGEGYGFPEPGEWEAPESQ